MKGIGTMIQKNIKEIKNLQNTSQTNLILEKYGSSNEFLITFNPEMQYKYCKDIERCFLGNAPTLDRVSQAYREEVTESWLAIQLRDLSEFAGCRSKMSTVQIDSLAKVIILNFSFLKVTELMFFFVQFKSGKYGKFYGAVDGLVITEALQEFVKGRNELIWKLEQNKQQKDLEAKREEWKRKAVSYEEYKRMKSHDSNLLDANTEKQT